MSAVTLLGIDIGGTKIAGGIVEIETGRVLLSERIPTGAREGGPAVLRRAIALGARLIAQTPTRGIAAPFAVGIGAGGQIDADAGIVLSATEILPAWAGTRLKDAFTEALGLPATADNDVNALAAGESRFGAGQGLANVVFLALGTGVGGGILSGGRLHRSARGVSGELGHLILYPDGRPCTCGGRGCLEQYVSGPALVQTFHELGGDPALTDGAPLGEMAQSHSNSVAAQAITRTGEALGLGLVSLANIFGPDRFIIGGGLAALGDRLLEPARRVLAERALRPVRDVPVLVAALGQEASIIGAAALALPGV